MSDQENINGSLMSSPNQEARGPVRKEPSAALSRLRHRLDDQLTQAAGRLREALVGDNLNPTAAFAERPLQDNARDTGAPALPDLPAYRGVWYPVYWTPIPGSGERITVLIVAKGEDGQVCMRSTISDALLEFAFGNPKAAALRQMFDYVEKMLPDWLESYESRSGTASGAVPVTGFTLGVARSSCADNVRQLAAQGICLDAAFADVTFADLDHCQE
jgi:hypothetical protein